MHLWGHGCKVNASSGNCFCDGECFGCLTQPEFKGCHGKSAPDVPRVSTASVAADEIISLPSHKQTKQALPSRSEINILLFFTHSALGLCSRTKPSGKGFPAGVSSDPAPCPHLCPCGWTGRGYAPGLRLCYLAAAGRISEASAWRLPGGLPGGGKYSVIGSPEDLLPAGC